MKSEIIKTSFSNYSTASVKSPTASATNPLDTWMKPAKTCFNSDPPNVNRPQCADQVSSSLTNNSFSDVIHVLQHPELKIILSKISEINTTLCNNISVNSKFVHIHPLYCGLSQELTSCLICTTLPSI